MAVLSWTNAQVMAGVGEIVVSTLYWALLATVCVVAISLPVAYAMARHEFAGKRVLSTVFSMPLVLPPTAVGFLLLHLFATDGWLGPERLGIDVNVLLNWKGVVLACAVMSFPLVVRTARVSFEEVDPRLEQIARTLGCGAIETFFRVTLPLASRGLVAAAILGFTRCMGEFGASVMVAGNIPGKTQTLAAAIYTAQQSGDEGLANQLLVIAFGVGFAAVFLTEWLTRPRSVKARSLSE